MQSFIIALLTCSVTMSALGIFYIAITPLISKRYSAKGRYYAWLIIVVGLIIPFRPNFDNAVVQINIPSEAVTPAVQTRSAAITPVVQTGSETVFAVPDIIPAENTAAIPTAVTASVSWRQVAAAVWLIGVIAFIAYHLIKHYCFVKMARRWSENITDERILTLFHELKAEMGITKRIELYLCSSVGSPMMIGLIKPRIFLPAVNFAQDELRFILKHELVHYKRKDLLYKCLALTAAAVHWFNPLVYLIARAISAQCELSCDAEVVKSADEDTRRHYSETIIGVVNFKSRLKTALSTNFYGGKKGMKNRISSIMDTRKKRLGFVIIGIMLAATVCTGFALAASVNAADNETEENSDVTVTVDGNNDVTATVVGITVDSDSAHAPEFPSGGGVLEAITVTAENADPLENEENLWLENFYIPEHYIPEHAEIERIERELAEEMRAIHDTWGTFEEIFTGVEAFGITFDGSLADWDTDVEPGNIYYEGRLVRSLIDENYYNGGGGVRFEITSGRRLRQDIPSGLDIYVVRDLNGDINAIGITVDSDSAHAPEFPSGGGVLEVITVTDTMPSSALVGSRTMVELFADLEEFGITFDGELFNGGHGNIYYQGRLVRTLDNGGGVWLTSSDRGGSVNIRIIRDNSGTVTGVEEPADNNESAGVIVVGNSGE